MRDVGFGLPRSAQTGRIINLGVEGVPIWTSGMLLPSDGFPIPNRRQNDSVALGGDVLFAVGDFGNHLGGFLEGVIGSRHAAIDRLLYDDFLDVVFGKVAFGERGPYM
jgi:hypothetical protein